MPRIVTTSWDDGDQADLKVADLLRSRGLVGTFYVPMIGHNGRSTLEPAGMRSLASAGFEIGAHGFSHHPLPQFRSKELAREVGVCKERLEDILGGEVRTFCYPKGRYTANVLRYVRAAGYCGARTTRMLATKLHFDPFEMPTSLQAYPHTKPAYLRNLLRARNMGRLYVYLTQLRRVPGWVELGRCLFDRVLQEGGVWHLFGHSWEIEKLGLWDDLKRMLDYVSRREGVLYLSNYQVLGLLEPKSCQ